MKPLSRIPKGLLLVLLAAAVFCSCARQGPSLQVALRQKPVETGRLDRQAEKQIVGILAENQKLTEARKHFRPGEGGHDALSLRLIENHIHLDNLGYKRLDEREKNRLLEKALPSA